MRVRLDLELPRNRNARRQHLLRVDAACYQPRFCLLGCHAVKIHAGIHPKRMRLEIGDHANGERMRSRGGGPKTPEDFQGHEMRANHHVGLERLQMLDKAAGK